MEVDRSTLRAARAERTKAALAELERCGWRKSRIAREMIVDRSTVGAWFEHAVPDATTVKRLEQLAFTGTAPGPTRPPDEIGGERDRLRQQRDVLLMLVLALDHRVAVLEQAHKLCSPRTPELDAINAARITEVMGTSYADSH